MSKALAVKPLPPDFPMVEPLPKGINIRKAMAGIHLLNGEGSQFRCLVKAGFSRATARNLTQAGLRAETCIAEAAKLDSMANPAKMLEAGRARAMLAIQSCDPKTVPLKDAMKMLDTIEKYYGGHELQPTNALITVADRLAQVASLLAVAQARGLPVPRAEQPYIEAKVIENEVTSTALRDVTPDGTTR
jgi:hypothetical protein